MTALIARLTRWWRATPAPATRSCATDPALEWELAAMILERQGDATGRVTISAKLGRMLAVLARREARRLRSGGL